MSRGAIRPGGNAAQGGVKECTYCGDTFAGGMFYKVRDTEGDYHLACATILVATKDAKREIVQDLAAALSEEMEETGAGGEATEILFNLFERLAQKYG